MYLYSRSVYIENRFKILKNQKNNPGLFQIRSFFHSLRYLCGQYDNIVIIKLIDEI